MNTRVNGYSSNVGRFGTFYGMLSDSGIDYRPQQPEITLEGLRSYLNDLESQIKITEIAADDHEKIVESCKAAVKEAVHSTRVVLTNLSRASSLDLFTDALILLQVIRSGEYPGLESRSTLTGQVFPRISFEQSFINRVEAFQSLVTMLMAHPGYKPINGFDSLNHLHDLEKQMLELRTELALSAFRLAQGKVTCERLLYARSNGAMARIGLAKSHVKRTYGKGSKEFLTLNAIRLSRSVKMFTEQ